MKAVYKEFFCPQCGTIRYIYVNGVCDSCRTENELERIIHERVSAIQSFN